MNNPAGRRDVILKVDDDDIDPLINANWRILGRKSIQEAYAKSSDRTRRRRRSCVGKCLQEWKKEGVPKIAYEFLNREHPSILEKYGLRRHGHPCQGMIVHYSVLHVILKSVHFSIKINITSKASANCSLFFSEGRDLEVIPEETQADLLLHEITGSVLSGSVDEEQLVQGDPSLPLNQKDEEAVWETMSFDRVSFKIVKESVLRRIHGFCDQFHLNLAKPEICPISDKHSDGTLPSTHD